MLTYKNGLPKIMEGKMLDELTRLYIPWDDVVTEFQIEYTDFSLSQSKGLSIPYVPSKAEFNFGIAR